MDPSLSSKRTTVLRAVAIAWVFFHHYHEIFATKLTSLHYVLPIVNWDIVAFGAKMLNSSNAGIRLFWFISGYCIHTSYLRWRNRTAARSGDEAAGLRAFAPTFLWRRFWRLYPPYLVGVILFYSTQYWGHLFDMRSLSHLSLHVTMTHIYFEGFMWNINPTYWSLAVEMQRYVLYPALLLPLYSRFGARTAFLVCLGITLVWQLSVRESTTSLLVRMAPLSFWLEWLSGAWLADRYAKGPITLPGGARIWMAGAAALVMASVQWWMPAWVRFPLLTLFFATLFVGYVHAKRRFQWWERALVPVGLCSFSIFLLHHRLLIDGAKLAGPHIEGWSTATLLGPVLAVACITVLALSWIYRQVIEQPSPAVGTYLANAFARWRSQRIARREPQVAPAPTGT
jgi:peptidoglycan/LPS O-acetylase OafA/YrhL